MSNRELFLMGSVTAERYEHPAAEIRLCKSVSDAVYISMRSKNMTQAALAERINVSASYMNLLFNGKRPWQEKHLKMVRKVTGSLATLQFAAMQEGVEIYVDELAVREAQARAVLAEIDEERRAA